MMLGASISVILAGMIESEEQALVEQLIAHRRHGLHPKYRIFI
jgi:hypothetical protein